MYANLQCPVGKDLKALFQIDPSTVTTVAIQTIREKSARSLDVPDVNFPIIILPYLKIHLKYVRKMIIGNSCSNGKYSNDFQPLLVHSRYGDHLTTSNISHSIALFMTGVSTRLRRVTAMTLRASFATSMLHQYRSGRLGENMTEERFLELTAKQMNTSVEQLRGTYASCYRSDFGATMNLISRHFNLMMETDDADSLSAIGEVDTELH